MKVCHRALRMVTSLMRMVFFSQLLLLVGCIQMHTTVFVSKDGSGTIEQKMLFTGMFADIMNKTRETAVSDQSLMLPAQKELEEMAAGFGPEVRVIGVQEISDNGESGYMTRFAFDDIETVRIGNAQKMNRNLSSGEEAVKPDNAESGTDETWFTFTMKQGATPEMVINKQSEIQNSSRNGSVPEAGSEEEQLKMLDMIAPFLKGMKMNIDLVVDGGIVRSNASFRSGNRINLYAIDFDRLVVRRDLFTGKYVGLSDREFISRAGTDTGFTFEFKERVFVTFN